MLRYSYLHIWHSPVSYPCLLWERPFSEVLEGGCLGDELLKVKEVRHQQRCPVAHLKDLKPLRPGIQLAFCICDPHETSGFSRAEPLGGLGGGGGS